MISKNIKNKMAGGSWIRKMFEEGSRLKAVHGEENVFDFSLGNPDLEPPRQVLHAIRELAESEITGSHGYMSNIGYLETRQAIADDLSSRSGRKIGPEAICMTVGAAGGLNVALKSILDENDEVIILAPFFVEYISYIENHGGTPVIVSCDSNTLLPDIGAIEKSITAKTKAIIINSPNNPSGRIYPADLLTRLDNLLKAQDHTIYILSDEPYRDLVFDGQKTPESLSYLTNLLVCFSWSKSLSLPGERIGYVAVGPDCEDYKNLVQAVGYCNRTLGFVNAPAFFQRVITKSLNSKVEVSLYEKRRDRLYQILKENGFELESPQGGLYLFIRSPEADDSKFAEVCAAQRVLLVPGRGFGFPGYARLCFAVKDSVIENSAEAFRKIADYYGFR
jgi:aspartate aminotransferase